LLLLRGGLYRGARVLAVVTVGAVMCGWGVAQYPYLLGTHLTIEQAAAPQPTLWVLVAVACAAALLIVPSLVLLFVLQQRGSLGAHD
jgi:cytochrome d ubiquinol oxidase subunit II